MTQQGLAGRIDTLESRVEALDMLPERLDRLESQLLQLRGEMRGEFSAVRGEMRELGEQLRGEMQEQGEQLRGEMRERGAQMYAGIANLAEMLSRKIDEGLAQTNAQMRLLHEEALRRIALLDEGMRTRKKAATSATARRPKKA